MAEYDGSVRIITLMDTKKAEEQLEKLENSISKSADKLSKLSEKMKEMKSQKIPTDEYKNLQVQLQEAEKALSNLLKKNSEYKSWGLPETTDFSKDIAKAEVEIQRIKNEMESLEKAGSAYSGTGADTEAYQKLVEQADLLKDKMQEQEEKAGAIRKRIAEAAAEEERLKNIKADATVIDREMADMSERRAQLEQEIADLKKAGVSYGYAEYDSKQQELAALEQEIKEYANSIPKASEQLKKLRNSVEKAFSAFTSGAKKSLSIMKNVAKKAFSTLTEGAKESNKSLGTNFKTILKYTLGIRSLYVLFNKMRSAVKEGFSNLAQYSDTTNKNISLLMSSLTQLKNSLATAFNPILTVVTPILTSFINMLAKAASYVGMVIAALTGQSIFTRATAVQENYAKSLNSTASAAKKAAGALAGFDDLDVLQQQENAGGAGAGTAIADMFEDVAIPDKFQNLADKIKGIFQGLFEPLKAAWESEGQYVLNSWKYALNEIRGLSQSIGADFLEMWRQQETVTIFENILRIIGDIGVVVGNLAHNFREAWEENSTGLHILETIRDIFGDIVQHIKNAADYMVGWAQNVDFEPMLNTMLEWLKSLEPAIDAVLGIMEDFYTTVLLPLGKWVLEKGLPELLDVFIAFNDLVDWERLKSNLKKFWEYLEPFAETVGEGLIIFIDRCSNALANFVNSETFEELLAYLENFMESVSPENVADGIQALVTAIIGLNVAGAVVNGLVALSAAFNMLSTAAGVVTGALGIISSTVVEILAVIGGAILAVTNFFSMWQEGFSAVKEVLMLLGIAISAIGAIILGAPVLVAGVVAAIIAAIASMAVVIHDNWNSIVEFFVGIGKKFNEALDELKGLLGNAVAALSGLVTDAIEIGENIVNGLIQGIKNAWNSLKETVGSTAGNIINTFKDTLGIHSPSTVMDENGVYLIEGLKNGISSTIDSVFALFAADQWSQIGQNMLDGITPSIESMKELFATSFANMFLGVNEQVMLFIETWNLLFTEWMLNNSILYFGYDVWYELFENFMLAYSEVNGEFMEEWQSNMNTWWAEMVEPFFSLEQWTLFGTQMKDGILAGFKSIVGEIGKILNNIIEMFDSAFKKLEESMNDLISDYNANARIMGTPTLDHVSYEPMGAIKIPALASGAVIRGGNPFLAMLGDQPHGQTNIEAPLSTIEQAVENAMAKNSYASGFSTTISLNVNGQEFARLTLGDILKEMSRQGYDVDVLGVT